MSKVLVVGEDRTGGGLQQFIQNAVIAERATKEKPPLVFPAADSRLGRSQSNSELVRDCGKYGLFRTATKWTSAAGGSEDCFDHVYYVVDARGAWQLVGMPEPAKDEKDLANYLKKLRVALESKMEQSARKYDGYNEQATWDGVKDGFHPHVLVWERESLILPVLDKLGLGNEKHDSLTTRKAAEVVDRLTRSLKGGKYDKATNGRALLGRIATQDDLWNSVLNAVPSVKSIVDALVAL